MKKSVTIDLDKIRNLRFGTNAIAQSEELLDRKLLDVIKNGASLRELRVMIYCGLVWEDPSLTLETVGDLMDDGAEKHGFEYLGEKLGEAITLAYPDKKKQPPQKKKRKN